MAICNPGSGFSPGTESAGTLILDFPTSSTMKNKFLLFKPHSLWYSVIATRAKTCVWPGKMSGQPVPGPERLSNITRGHTANWGHSPLKSPSLFSKLLPCDLDQVPFLPGPQFPMWKLKRLD